MKLLRLLFVAIMLLSVSTEAYSGGVVMIPRTSSQEKSESSYDAVLAPLVERTLLAIDKTGDFVVEQAPSILREFYQWRLYHHIFFIVLCVVASIIMLLIVRNLKKNDTALLIMDDPSTLHLFQIIPLVGICYHTYSLVMLIVAPKLYLIDYFIK